MKCTQIKCGATQIGKHHHNAIEKKDVANLLGHCKDSKFTSLFQRNNNIFAPIIGNSYCKGLLTYYVQQITLNNRFSILIE